MIESKKHILILSKWYPNKKDIQLGVFVKQQALLLKNKFQISVIYVQSDEYIDTKHSIITSTTQGIFEQVIYYKKVKGIFSKLINFGRYYQAQRLGYKNLKQKVDICHVHVPIRPALLALHLLNKKKIPFVVTEHWSGHLNDKFNQKNVVYKLLYKFVLKKANKVSCVSEFLKNKFAKNTGITPLLIPNLIEKVTPQRNDNINRFVNILSVNDYIDSIKNITGLLKGFEKACKIDTNLHLTLIGGGPDEELINKTIKNLNICNKYITVLGRITHQEVLNQIQNCDFYISNSNFETFGMTIAEALITGKPVISTLSGGPNEFLNSTNSITIDKNDTKSLRDAILKMSKTYQNYNSSVISKNISESYGKNKVLENLITFYNMDINYPVI